MRKVLIYSILLVLGLIGSQTLGPSMHPNVERAIALATMFALSFIMIHVGYEFELDKSNLRQYGWDYVVAGVAASIPWIFCTLYFVYAMSPRAMWHSGDLWRSSLLEGLFAAPTSAGVLFAMLAAAGLGATWLFQKARVLAIFDDLHTILLLIPLKMLLIGPRWQLAFVAIVIVALLWVAYRYLNALPLPSSWPWVMLYCALIVGFSELIHWGSLEIDPSMPIHLEVLLPAFAIGCVMRTPPGEDPHRDDAQEGVEEGPESALEQHVSTVMSALFMVLVGLSMPPIGGAQARPELANAEVAQAHATVSQPGFTYAGVSPEVVAQRDAFPGWGMISIHVLVITILSNIGKLFPAMCYRREAPLRHRLALAVGMFPRGEVGAGVLVIALSYNIAGPPLTVAVLSLALNLLLTGVFIIIAKRLIAEPPTSQPAMAAS
jgi:Kef-type K+ transport system membrane component KefB